MALDDNMLVVALIAVGIIAFAASGGQGTDEPVNVLGEVLEMEVDELDKYAESKVAKKADLGDLPYRGQQICAYLTDKTGFMLGIQNFFERGMQDRDVTWLREHSPDHYALLRTSIEYCNERAIEFKELWLELTHMTDGGQEWMRTNTWIVDVPRNVSNKLSTYFNVSLDSIQRYHERFTEQMGRQQLQLNEELQRQLGQFQNEAFRVIQGQANFFKAFAQSQAAQIDRLENQLNQVEMEVDEEGQWLIQNPLEDGQIRYQVAREMQWRDLNGNIRARQVVDAVHMPQHLVGGGYGYGPQDDYDDYNTGQGWDMKGDGGGETDKFGLRKPNQKALEYRQPTRTAGARPLPRRYPKCTTWATPLTTSSTVHNRARRRA